MAPGVTIVILNWNGRKFLEQFLPSVVATRYENFEVLLVDNGSTDDSVAFVNAQYPELRLLELDQNYGFTEGNNKALPHVETPYYVLLNSDVEVEPDWLGPLVEVMEADPKVASVQPKLLAFHQKDHFEYAGAAGGYLDRLAYPFSQGRLFDVCEKDTAQYEQGKEIMWATGACCLIRKSVTDEIGLFEGRYFAHMEEIDFCWRAQNYGYKIWYTPKSKVYHVGGGTLKRENPFKTFLNVRNSLATLIKNFPSGQVWYKLLIRMSLDGIWGIRSLLRGEYRTTWAIIRGHWAIWGSLGYWIKRRKEIYRQLGKVPAPRAGYYKGSIVWQYFGRGKRKFSDLPDIQ